MKAITTALTLSLLVFYSLLSAPLMAGTACDNCPDAQHASVTFLLDMPRAEAWQKLQDFSLAHNYVPNVIRTEIVSSAQNGIGAHRRVYDPEGGFIEESIIDWREGEGFLLRLHKGEQAIPPMAFSQFRYQLADSDDGSKTRVTLSLSFVMPWGWFGDKLGAWLVRPLLSQNLVAVAAGMKYYYETGESPSEQLREAYGEKVLVL